MHALALGFFAAGVALFVAVATRGIVRTLIDIFKFAIVGVVVLGVIMLVAGSLFYALVKDDLEPQIADTKAAGTTWLTAPERGRRK
jgi:predicted membrane channel-forming protein YqfA (hemolysin III family)